MKYKVIHHQRFPFKGQVSIERLFEEIRDHMPQKWTVEAVITPCPSKGLLNRIRNLIHARAQPADVHHIVGDIHYLAFVLPRRKTVLTLHDCATLERLSGLKRALFKWLWFSGPIRHSHIVTTISHTTKEELRKWIGTLANNIVVVPNCIRSEFLESPKQLNPENPVCLQVGTGWNKNLIRVAEALVGTSCHLEIVGTLNKTQRATLQELGIGFTELGQVSDSDLVEAYQRCDFLIFASLYEGFGLPILEAQATGRPVVTSNCSSMPEAAGDGALFVDPESVNDIRQAVDKLLSQPALREDLIKKGFQNVKKHSPEIVADSYCKLYEQLVKTGHQN